MSDTKLEAIKYIEKSLYALLVTVDGENKPCSRYIGPIVTIDLDIYFVTRIVSQKVSGSSAPGSVFGRYKRGRFLPAPSRVRPGTQLQL